MADDAAAVLAALNVPSADVLGYSMGGTTAIFAAIRDPNRVAKQIIVAGTSRRDGWYPELLQSMAHIGLMAEAERIAELATPTIAAHPGPRAFSRAWTHHPARRPAPATADCCKG